MNAISIVYEDDDMVVIDKPAGLVVHFDGRTEEETVVGWVENRYPSMGEVGEPLVLPSGQTIKRPGIVHRIDRETSGLLVIAKTQTAFLHLKKQFQGRMVEKTYLAFVHGGFRESDGVIDMPIGRSKSDFRKWATGMDARDHVRPAFTAYRVVDENNEAAYVEVKPKTGRTHQIRVHMNAIGHPVVGDQRYAPKRPLILGFERLALHAAKISLTGLSGDAYSFEAPLPADFVLGRQALIDSQ